MFGDRHAQLEQFTNALFQRAGWQQPNRTKLVAFTFWWNSLSGRSAAFSRHSARQAATAHTRSVCVHTVVRTHSWAVTRPRCWYGGSGRRARSRHTPYQRLILAPHSDVFCTKLIQFNHCYHVNVRFVKKIVLLIATDNPRLTLTGDHKKYRLKKSLTNVIIVSDVLVGESVGMYVQSTTTTLSINILIFCPKVTRNRATTKYLEKKRAT